ncbi:MAG: VWA-like domain-containing protein, partial [Acutalibacteraceae bacterium]|nr:VWA-like domain-containing protein [Acutalibacteraceae bacterium]
IWFLIDTSGSISDAAINAAYGEICSAIDQFNGHIEGLLSFTESYVTEPIPFESISDLMAIKPVGGGGNDFSDIFRYMRNNMRDNLPGHIVIITDGYDTFPPEHEAMGVPVLWIINNNDTQAQPPWGKVARIKV